MISGLFAMIVRSIGAEFVRGLPLKNLDSLHEVNLQ